MAAPKPWQTRSRTAGASTLMDSLNLQSTTRAPVLGGEDAGLATGPSTANQISSGTASSLTSRYGATRDPLSSLGGGLDSYSGLSSYSSPYSSYGGGYGGYSRYGGYGGLGGYGGYGGYGRYGSLGMNGTGDPNQRGFFENSMQYLDNVGFAVSSLCDMTRTVETHADGLTRLWHSMVGLVVRVKNWGVNGCEWVVDFFSNLLKRMTALLSWTNIKAHFKDPLKRQAFLKEFYKFLVRLFVTLLLVSIIAPYYKSYKAEQAVTQTASGLLDSAFKASN